MAEPRGFLISENFSLILLLFLFSLGPNFSLQVTAQSRTLYSEGVATIVQGAIVQGDSCPRDFCPMTQLSKQTIVHGDFGPRSKSYQVKAAHTFFSHYITLLYSKSQ